MRNHIIICGLGNVGFRTFELLKQAGKEIVVVSNSTHDELRWQVEKTGTLFIVGDARSERLLLQAGILDAKVILAITDEDVVNSAIIMSARHFNPTIKIIARMFDRELSNHISKAFNVQQIFSISEIVAPIFTNSIVDRSIVAQFSLENEIYGISEKSDSVSQDNKETLLTIATHNLVVTPLKEEEKNNYVYRYFLRKFNYILSPAFAHFRFFLLMIFCFIISTSYFLKSTMLLSYIDAIYFVTTTITTVGYGDINFLNSSTGLKIFGCLLMLCGAGIITLLFGSIVEIMLSRKLPSVLGGLPVPKKDHVIVVGSGHIGHRIVTKLLEQKSTVVIVENDMKNRYSTDINRQVALVEGHFHSDETFKRAHVETAKAILAITEDDIENLSISLTAKKLNAKIINITRLFSGKLAYQLQSFLSLDGVLSVENLSAPYFAAAVFGQEILVALKWQKRLIFLSRGVDVPPNVEHAPLTLGKKIFKDIQVCSINLQ